MNKERLKRRENHFLPLSEQRARTMNSSRTSTTTMQISRTSASSDGAWKKKQSSKKLKSLWMSIENAFCSSFDSLFATFENIFSINYRSLYLIFSLISPVFLSFLFSLTPKISNSKFFLFLSSGQQTIISKRTRVQNGGKRGPKIWINKAQL